MCCLLRTTSWTNSVPSPRKPVMHPGPDSILCHNTVLLVRCHQSAAKENLAAPHHPRPQLTCARATVCYLLLHLLPLCGHICGDYSHPVRLLSLFSEHTDTGLTLSRPASECVAPYPDISQQLSVTASLLLQILRNWLPSLSVLCSQESCPHFSTCFADSRSGLSLHCHPTPPHPQLVGPS